jgi:hypothetical protein
MSDIKRRRFQRGKYTACRELLDFYSADNEKTGCREWTEKLNHAGYGRVCIDGKDVLAHRLSYELAYGPITNNLKVCHHCDNAKCVNPEHLFLGTQQDNLADMVKKGRHIRGKKQWKARLNEEYVKVIRLLNWKNSELAKIFSVTPDNIKRVKARKSWAHVL